MPLTLRLAGGVRTGAGAVKRGGEVGNGTEGACLPGAWVICEGCEFSDTVGKVSRKSLPP